MFPRGCGFNIQKRYFVSVWITLGAFLLFLIRSNLVIALIEMTSNKTIVIGNETVVTSEFNYEMKEKGFILSAFSFGYGFSCFTGFLVYRFGGVTTYGAGVLLTGILAILSPPLIHTHLSLFLVARVLQGVSEGLSMSATMDIFARWAPPTERARMTSSVRFGAICAIAINFPISGYVAHRWGWEAIFYQSGILSLVWYAIWFIFMSNDPADDKFISEGEKLYLKEVIENVSETRPPVPWKKLFTSKPVYALFNEFFTMAWTYSFITFNLPLYIKDILQVDTQYVGLITGVPMLCGAVMLPIAAWIVDYLRSNVYTVSKVHKMVIFWAQVVVLLSLVGAAIWGNFLVCIICFSVLRTAFSFADTSYTVISIDMAGQYAGILSSICSSVNSVGALFSPLVLGFIVSDNTQSQWNFYFLILSIITMYGVIMFCIFGSGELQPWAVVEEKKNENCHNFKLEQQIDRCVPGVEKIA